ncbi:catalase [Nocardiopsis sp. SBT366]|uniref:catalase n=1 Tax=Nocardiopsis sp. SBT366 TaxID=1580529 RepID=UPI00066C0682|nr:catalase [Nocardiopsis sp. SBT366]
MVDKRPESERTTTNAGIPAPSDEHSLTVGSDGPIVLHDAYLVEKMAHFNRERVPERVVHAKGSGAYGTFQVTNDVSEYTRADLFQPGRRTPMLARFSTVAGEMGSPDTWRDPRGFALKFYTREGNFDMVGNNTPVFFVRDPQKFQDFIRSQKRDPRTGLRDNTMQWDFWSLSPETSHQVTWLMGDRGVPRTWRNMDGFSSHTYQWINAKGQRFWVKYHFRTDQGNDFLTQEESDRMAGEDADHHRRDLFEAIERSDHPSWTLSMQIMPIDEAAGYRYNPFDLTKVWPKGDYPLIEVGRMTLDRNPDNHFIHIEQAAFEPSNMVPGTGASPDKMLLGRMFSYPDTHRYRIGVNYDELPPNRPHAPVRSYGKDGAMRHYAPDTGQVYHPNSYGGPDAARQEGVEEAGWKVKASELLREAYRLREDDDNVSQPRALIRHVMDDAARDRLVSNIVGHVSAVTDEGILQRALKYWSDIDPGIGARVAEGVNRS